MANVTVKIEGLSKLGEAMRGLGFEVQDKLSRQATRGAANLVQQSARNLAPKLTGALKQSVQVRRDKKNSHPGFEVMAVGVFKIGGKGAIGKGEESPAFYWKFVEFGTVKMHAQSFLRKGFDEDKAEAGEKMGNVLAEGIEKKVRSYK